MSTRLAIVATLTGLLAAPALQAREQCFFKGGESRGRTDLSIVHPDQIAIGQTLHRISLVLTEPLLAACMHNDGPSPKDMRLSLEHENHAGQVPAMDGYFSQGGKLIGQRVRMVVPASAVESIDWTNPLIKDYADFQAEPGYFVGAQPTRWTQVLPAGTHFLYEVAKVEDLPAQGNMQSTTAFTMRVVAAGSVRHDMGPIGTGNVFLHFMNKPTCSVVTTSMAINLGRIDPDHFEQTGESDPVRGAIELDCRGGDGAVDSETQVYLHLNDAYDPGSTSTLLAPAPGTTARGVAVQIRQPNGRPIAFDPSGLNQWWVMDALAGRHEIPLQFVAVRTGSQPLVQGSVGGMARFTVTYY